MEKTNNETIMKLGIAKWMVQNTKLSVIQISNFCSLSPYDVRRIKSDKYRPTPRPVSPIGLFVLKEDVEFCEKNPLENIQKKDVLEGLNVKKPKTKVFTSKLQKSERNNCVLWFVQNHPEISDSRISKLTRTTPQTVLKIRVKTHQEYKDLIPKKPSNFGLCSLSDIESSVLLAQKRSANKKKKGKKNPV